MSRLTRLTRSAAAAALLAASSLLGVSAEAATKIRVQSVIPNTADEVVMLQDFANDVKELTGGEVEFEILPAGAVVGVQEILDAVDAQAHHLAVPFGKVVV